MDGCFSYVFSTVTLLESVQERGRENQWMAVSPPLPSPTLPLCLVSHDHAGSWRCRSSRTGTAAGAPQCCRSYHIPVTAEERARIEGQGWEDDPELKDTPFFVREQRRVPPEPPARRAVRLPRRGQPLPHPREVRLRREAAGVPRLPVPAGPGRRPLAARAAVRVPRRRRQRRPAAGRARRRSARVRAADGGGRGPPRSTEPPPPLQAGQVGAVGATCSASSTCSRGCSARPTMPLERRWRKVLVRGDMVRKATFDGGGDAKKAVTGGRLSEMLHVLGDGRGRGRAEDRGGGAAAGVGRAGGVPAGAGRVRPQGPRRRARARPSAAGSAASLAASRFARGKGRMPKVHALIPETTFAAAEQPAGPLSPTRPTRC